MKRGEVWQVDLGAKTGKRPTLILTRGDVIPFRNKLTVAEITTQKKGYPTEVDIDQKANLPGLLLYNSTTPNYSQKSVYKIYRNA